MSNYPILIEKYEPDEDDLARHPDAQLSLEVAFTISNEDLIPDLAELLDDARIAHGEMSFSSVLGPGADPSGLIGTVVTILGTAGGLGGIAAILKAFFGRSKGKSVKFGEDGEVVQADGLSVAEIVRLIEALDRKERDLIEVEIIEDEPDKPDELEISPGV